LSSSTGHFILSLSVILGKSAVGRLSTPAETLYLSLRWTAPTELSSGNTAPVFGSIKIS